jgi:hypothetical protein
VKTDYIPASDAGKLAFCGNFSAIVSVDYAALGVDAATAALLASRQAAYAAALALASDPATRGGATVRGKDQSRRELLALVRDVARMVRNNVNVSDARRFALGLTPRRGATAAAAIPAPDAAPFVHVASVSGRTVRLRLRDSASSSRRGRPPRVASASLFTHVGPTPPASLAGWAFAGNTAGVRPDVTFPADVPPGSSVWVAARWNNARLLAGPMSAPANAYLSGGLVDAA